MNIIRRNVIANFTGNIWIAVMSLLFVPLYVKYLGVSSYGLVGFFATLQALFALFDLGLRPTLNRELARLSVTPDSDQAMHDLLRTLEIIYWIIALCLCLLVLFLSPFIAKNWLHSQELPPRQVQLAIMLMGVCLLFRWPLSLYSGGLQGLQRQPALNAIAVVSVTARGLGAITLLHCLPPSIQLFFSWQALSFLMEVFAMRIALRSVLPSPPAPARFKKQSLYTIWRFAAGMTGISIQSVIISQFDKIIVSKLLPLKIFGYYTLASVIATTLFRLFQPIQSAIYPRFAQLSTFRDPQSLRVLYHKTSQFVAVLVFPVVGMLCIFSRPMLLLWLKEEETAEHTYRLLSLLIISNGLNIAIYIPGILLSSHAILRPVLTLNTVGIIILAPLTYCMIKTLGVIGAPVGWLVYNIFYFLVFPSWAHRHLLGGELKLWYAQDILLPFALSILVPFLMQQILPTATYTGSIFILAGIYGTSLLVTASALPAVRRVTLKNTFYILHMIQKSKRNRTS